jgi:uncharacterized protein YyaL (SSP411 family)
MNNLHLSTNPYLLQHKDNPVHWQIWSEDVFTRAAHEDKPVLLSIGYSTCHWCHVMEHESFEDEAIAEIMNQHFICIKLDREERPDLDAFYMLACQLLTGQGGWPLNCFLLPDKRPFYAGTYFPPKPSYGRPSWPQLLNHITQLYQNKQDIVRSQADKLMQVMQDINADKNILIEEDELILPVENDAFIDTILAYIDKNDGGFGTAPKFPQAPSWQLLITASGIFDQVEVSQIIHLTLAKMIHGGLWDHLRGGFARYAVDKYWRVPHFEKMLYDNAWLISDYSLAYAVYKKVWMKEIAIRTIDFWQQHMTDSSGLLYSALDADSNGHEGDYYTWTFSEINDLPGAELQAFTDNFELNPQGNWEGTHVLIFKDYLKATQYYSHPDENLRSTLNTLRERSASRMSPGIDYKIITSWNAWYGAALCDAAVFLQNDSYIDQSVRLLESIKNTNCKGNTIYHSSAKGVVNSVLLGEDYVSMAYWHLKLYQLTFDESHLNAAMEIIAETERLFSRPDNVFIANIPISQNDNLLAQFETIDYPTPSANSLLIHCYIQLYQLTKNTPYIYRYNQLAEKFKLISTKQPTSSMFALTAIIAFENANEQYLITGPESFVFAHQLRNKIVPTALIRIISDNTTAEKLNISLEQEKTLIYACKNFSCQLPVDNVEAFYHMP